MPENFFENHADAKRAMKDNLFTEVYLSTAVTTPIRLKGWVSQANPYERHVPLCAIVAARQLSVVGTHCATITLCEATRPSTSSPSCA